MQTLPVTREYPGHLITIVKVCVSKLYKGSKNKNDFLKALRYHKEGHAGTRKPKEKVVCAHCGGTYDKKQYIHHLRRKHGEEHIECQQCQTVFKVIMSALYLVLRI